jgi:hypothetical protein
MKITLWRFAHDCLPTDFQLRRGNVPASDACLFCNREERVEHALLFCPYVVEVWRAVKTAFPVLHRKDLSTPLVWVLDFLARSNNREMVTMVVMVWHIWDTRNAVRNVEERSLAEQIKAYIEMILLHLFKPPSVHRRESSSSPYEWSPPLLHPEWG